MATELKMPQLSDTMSSGKILSWKKKEGDKVSRGDILAEVETDKANLEIECFHPGTLIKIMVPEGSSANVGSPIAYIGEAGEVVSSSNGAAAKPIQVSEKEIKQEVVKTTSSPASATIQESAPSEASTDRIKVSPLAKKIAQESNLDLSSIRGSGPGGRIIRKDLDAASSGKSCQSTTCSSQTNLQESTQRPASAQSTPNSQGTLTPFSKMRETIARRMQESVNSSPHFYVTTTIKMDEASRLRELLKENPIYKGISVNHLIIKAAAYALSKERSINCAVKDGQLYSPSSINIGIVTAIPDGLLIPVIKDTDKLTLKDIVFEAKAAIERAKAGRPSSSDLSGGTFSISNMGMFDVENFTAIVSPGQGAILAVSSTKEQAIVEKGQIVIAKQMKVTLSSDHRIIDGIMAANFLKHLKDALETPALLALE